jgi:NADH-quinone oxidoreductase subunit F
VERALELAEGIDGRTFCPMGAALVNPSRSAIAHFRDEFEYHIHHKQCHVPRS